MTVNYNTTMNREEKIKLIKGFSAHLANKGGLLASNFEQEVELYLDSLEMNKERAIELIQSMYDRCGFRGVEGNQTGEAIQFAIDYMKDEGEIIGWANYHKDSVCDDKWGSTYMKIENAKEAVEHEKDNVIQIPIRLPKK